MMNIRNLGPASLVLVAAAGLSGCLSNPEKKDSAPPPAAQAPAPAPVAAPVSVPTLMVTVEGDVRLFGAALGATGVASRGLGDGPARRHWHVAGAGHTEPTSPVMPSNTEIARAGRKPRIMTPETLATGSIFPSQVAITAALDAVVAWATTGTPAAIASNSPHRPDSARRSADGARRPSGNHPVCIPERV